MEILNLFKNWEDTVTFKNGTVIFAERDPADVMYVVLKGEIELTLNNEPLGIEAEGGIIGEMAMIVDSTRSATGTAMGKTKLARVNRDQFRELVGTNVDFALHVMAVLANRLRAINLQITSPVSQFR